MRMLFLLCEISGSFVKTFKIFVKSIFNWPRTHAIKCIFLSCLLSSFVDL